MTREERRAREATFPKCACGNVAGREQTQCGRCRAAAERDSRLDRVDVLALINAAEDVVINYSMGWEMDDVIKTLNDVLPARQ